MNPVLGASAPDDELDTVTAEAFSSDTNADSGFGAIAERGPTAPVVVQRPPHDRDDPGEFRTTPRARGSEGLTQAAWPIGAMLLVAGVAVLMYHLVGDPLAIMVGSVMTALTMLGVDHYVD